MKHPIFFVLKRIAAFLVLNAICFSTAFANCWQLYWPLALQLGSCQPPKTLKDGLYVGTGIGYDAYKVSEKLIVPPGNFTNPHLNVRGWVGSVFGGYGQYYDRLYIAGEAFANFSSADTNFAMTVPAFSYDTSINVRSSYGVAILPGVKLNPFTLLYARIGFMRTTFKSIETLDIPGVGSAGNSATKYGNGIQYGLGFESAIFSYFCDPCLSAWQRFFDHLSMRGEYTYTSFGSWVSEFNTSYTPSNNQFVLSFIYHIA